MPGALSVLSPVLCGTVSAEKGLVKPYKRGKAERHEQKRARLHTSAPAQKPGAELGSRRPGCGVASCFLVPVPELQEFIPSSILPVPPSPAGST